MKTYSFEKLEVWQEARKLALQIYKTTKQFPDDEKFGMTRQMRRASISICSNLAEGASRTSYKDQARFSEISFGSLMELLCQTILSCDLMFISEKELIELRNAIESIGFKLNKLKESQLEKMNSK